MRYLLALGIAVSCGLLAGCNGSSISAREGFLLTYVDTGGTVRVRSSPDGSNWNSGDRSFSGVAGDGVGAGVDLTGIGRLLGYRIGDRLHFHYGIGTLFEELRGPNNTASGPDVVGDPDSPLANSAPTISFFSKPADRQYLWIAAFRSNSNTASMRVYNSALFRMLTVELAPQEAPNASLDGRPCLARSTALSGQPPRDVFALAWQVGDEVRVAASTDVQSRFSALGSPTWSHRTLSDLRARRGSLALCATSTAFFLAFTTNVPVGSDLTRDDVVILRSADGLSWNEVRRLETVPLEMNRLGIAAKEDGTLAVVGVTAANDQRNFFATVSPSGNVRRVDGVDATVFGGNAPKRGSDLSLLKTGVP